MKVIVFVENFDATGVVRNGIAIAGRLSATGHQVTVLAARGEGVLRASIPAGVSAAGLTSGGAGLKRRDLMRRSVGRFRRLVREGRPDVVVSAGNHGHLLCLAVTRFPRVRTVVRISNDLDHGGDRSKRGAMAALIRRLKFRMILSLADRVVLVSKRLLTQVEAIDPRLARKAVVIPNGVDQLGVQALAKEEWSAAAFGHEAAPLVLALGRLVQQKNFGTLLEALAIARRSRDLRLLLIGSGPLEADLREQIERLGLADAVRIIDPVPNPFPAMKQAAVMVLPSWWEGSSNVLLEALACGTPIVASRTAGSAEEVLDGGRYGLLVDPDDAGALAAAILRQVGPSPLLPNDRAADYDRDKSLSAYADLIAGLARE